MKNFAYSHYVRLSTSISPAKRGQAPLVEQTNKKKTNKECPKGGSESPLDRLILKQNFA